ncbi:MAG: hypothetical protein K0Q47_136 [Sedimentibacter sp.]|jgi:hypothetical protein|nr:hypothetical protein [Sedimentibacter sp.]
MYSLEQINNLSDTIVKEFYDMNDQQRWFISSLVQNEKLKWTRIELMKMLMIFNYSVEIKCDIASEEVNQLSKFIDDNSKIISDIFSLSDNKFRKEHGAYN